MADPVGAPTLAQLFSPTKSPFYALSLAALACLTAIYNKPLVDYGSGFILMILTIATCLAPFFRPRYVDRTYGLSLMFGRAAGLIGAMVAMTILITQSFKSDGSATATLESGSPMFEYLWLMILIHAGYVGLLFFYKTVSMDETKGRFNIIQFCLMQSTLLIFFVAMAVSKNDFDSYPFFETIYRGGLAIGRSPRQLYDTVHISSTSIIYALILIWWIAGIINAIMLFFYVRLGWIEDHGDGVSN